MTTFQYSTELLSALADGELAKGIADAGLQDVFLSSALHGDWNSYQVIGHVLRGDAGASGSLGADPAFLQRLNMCLADEKIALLLPTTPSDMRVALPNQPAANEGVFRWKLVAGFASLSAALVIAWNFVSTPDASTALQLSQSPVAEQVVVASPQGPMVRDARLEELMTAHKQLSGSSLQAPSGFLRNAGFDNLQSSRR
jgi:sigma-E factor negative regulatory protein RseA